MEVQGTDTHRRDDTLTMASTIIWRNWHETVNQPVQRLELLRNADESNSTVEGYKATNAGIQRLIKEAADKKLSIRAVGGAWSFTTIAATDGIMLNTQRLNYRFALKQADLQQQYSLDKLPVLLQCGISVADVNHYLETRNQALPTSGASNGQTIAGALSTGTHGGAVRFGAIPEYVVAIHLATAHDGKTVWLERASRPVAKDSLIEKLGATPLRDDAVFNAALVSFGCFGIILGVVIEPTTSYFLHGSRAVYKLGDAHWNAIQNLDFAAAELPLARGRKPHHLELLCNVLDGERTLVTALYREEQFPKGAGPVKSDGGIGKGDAALDVIGAFTDMFSGSGPGFAKLLSKAYGPFDNIAGTPPQFFSDTSTRGKTVATGVGVPISRARETFEIACKAVHANQAPALVSMRFVKSTRATLGFTMHEPVTVVTEVDGANSIGTRTAQQTLWRKVREAGIPHSFHWGKLNDLDAAKLRLSYGQQRVDAWIAARRRLIRPELRRVFSNEFSKSLGVDD